MKGSILFDLQNLSVVVTIIWITFETKEMSGLGSSF